MGHTSPIETFLSKHRSQLLASGIPERHWEPLYKKLLTQSFDAGKSFQLVKFEFDEEKQPLQPIWGLQVIKDLDYLDTDNIFLIDHAWTYQVNDAKKHLRDYENLRLRLANVLGLEVQKPTEELVDEIFDNMWKINCTYSIRNIEDSEETKVWYVMDEIGCSVQHSGNPNCRIVPFVYADDGMYSVMFLQENVEEGDLMYRDFAEGIVDPIAKKAALLPWVPNTFDDLDLVPNIPGEDYFLSGHLAESYPELDKLKSVHSKKDKYLCFSQYSLVKQYLSDPKFEITEEEDKADILWYTKHFIDYKTLSETPEKFVNQFPYEYVITVKDLLCMTCRRYKDNKEAAIWFPVTYNLVNEVGNFARYFQQCESEGRENYWIIKPYNLARGMDIHITNNLNYIMRLSTTGPKIAQRYLTSPVLFYRNDCEGKVKFDLRYVILLKSVKPLKVYVYKNFFLRFANKPFELKDFDDYEKHFTVMNYTENANLKHMKCEDFKVEWQKQYDAHCWSSIEEKVLKMIKEIMECATKVGPPCGIAESPQSRAVYAADLMLDWVSGEIEPKILEINFMPDCERACKYYPNFYNDIFKLLFLDEESEIFFKL